MKCEKCGNVMYPHRLYTSHGVTTVYYCPNGCGGNTSKQIKKCDYLDCDGQDLECKIKDCPWYEFTEHEP